MSTSLFMARWRYWLLRWLMRHEEPEWLAWGLPPDRVTVVEIDVVIR